MNNLNADVRTLAQFNPHSKWFVKMILTHFDLVHVFQKCSSKLSHEHVRIQVELSRGRSNNFALISEKIDTISNFDFVLVKNSNIRLAGFEWNAFLDSNKFSMMSGPFRQNVEVTTSRYKKIIHERQNDPSAYVSLQDAVFFNTYQDKRFPFRLEQSCYNT